MSELNPNHPVTREMHEQWHKICILLMRKMGVREVVISVDEVVRMAEDDEGCAITIRADDFRGIILQIVSPGEAERLARKEGGLPV